MMKIRDWLQTPEISEIRKQPFYKIIEEGFHREVITPIWVDKERLFSPANGVILYVKRVASKDDIVMVHGSPFTLEDLMQRDIHGEFIVIGIYMTYLDVHINYMCSSGYIHYQKLQKLKIDNLSMIKVEMELLNGEEHPNTENMEYLFYNERILHTIYDNNIGQEYYLVQIADAEVNAIIPFKEQNAFVFQGEAFSAIRFGSQVDLIIPIKPNKHYDILCGDNVGWHVDAVRDPLVKIT